MNALIWSIVLDTAVATKNNFSTYVLYPFKIIKQWGRGACGNDHSPPQTFFFKTPVPFEVLKWNFAPVNKINYLRNAFRKKLHFEASAFASGITN